MVEEARLKKLAVLSKGSVLDIGYNANPNPYLKNAIGFDLKIEKEPSNYIKFVNGNCENISNYFKRNSFDTIIAGEVIEHLENPSRFLKECSKILEQEGRILITTPNPYNPFTILANIFFIKKYIESSDHINLFPFRNMVKLLNHCNLKLVGILNASGGIKIPFTKIYIPFFKGLTYQLMYIIKNK